MYWIRTLSDEQHHVRIQILIQHAPVSQDFPRRVYSLLGILGNNPHNMVAGVAATSQV